LPLSQSEADTGAAMRCATHPNVETYLRCAQCGTPICPRCLVITPVGAKCQNCSRLRLQPAFIFRPIDLLLAIVVSFGVGTAVGLVGSLVVAIVRIAAIAFPFVAGLALGAAISRVAGRRRHGVLKVVAGLGVVVSYVALSLGEFILRDPGSLLFPQLYGPLLVNLLVGLVVNPFNALFLILGIWIAIYRL
jgi:hypothetical protein